MGRASFKRAGLRQYLRLVPECDEMRKVCNQGRSGGTAMGRLTKLEFEKWIVFATLLAVILVGSADAQTLRQGVAEYNQRNYASASRIFNGLAETECGFRFIPAGYSDVKPAPVPI